MATTTTARKCTKKSAARAKLFFCRIFRIQNIRRNILPKFIRDLYEDAMLVPTWMGTNMVDGNQQKHLLLSIGTKE